MPATPTKHLAPDVLRAFGSGTLDAAASAAVLAHLLDGCVECRQAGVALMGADFIARLRAARPPAGTVVEALTPAETASSVPPPNLPATTPYAGPAVLPELRNHPQYEVMRELGRGGMGVVYLARNKVMDRPEVLKVVNKQFLDQPETAERFLREIRAAAKLSHANIVTAHSAVQAGELLAFAMEYVEGETLELVVRTRGRLPVANACYYTLQVALGLQHAFDKGLIHRDIKPQNLILAREGKKHVVKILDFGLAKATREGEAADRGLTGTGMMMGTPDYIAPEQTLDAARADIRADIYSLGCTLYFLLTGNPPFRAKSQFELLQAHHSKEATPLHQVRKDVPVELAAIVANMMAKDPALRYQKPVEVAQALGPFAKAGPKPLPPLPSPPALVIPVKTIIESNPAGTRAAKQAAAPAMADKGAVVEVSPPPARPSKDSASKNKIRPRQRRGNETEEREREPARSKAGLFIALAVGGVAVFAILGAIAFAIIVLSRGHDSSTADGGAPVKRIDDEGSKSAYDLTGGFRFVHFGPEGPRVVLRSNLNPYFAQVYDVTTEKPVCPPFHHADEVEHASFSPDGKRVVTASKDKTARVWDVITNQPLSPPLQHAGDVCHASFSPDGKRVITASWDNTALVWDAVTGQKLTPPLPHTSFVLHASFSPDGRRVVTASQDNTARVWDAATGEAVTPILQHGAAVNNASFSPDGKRVVTASQDWTARVWDAATGLELTPPLKHDDSIWHASFSPDGKRVVTASDDKTARVWDTMTGKPIGPTMTHAQGLGQAVFSPDGKRILTTGDSSSGTAFVWNVATGQEVTREEDGIGEWHASFSPDGKQAVTTDYFGSSATLWDSATGKVLKTVTVPLNP